MYASDFFFLPMFHRSVADASSSSCGLERARWPPAPSRNGAREVAMADEDGLLSVGLALEGENEFEYLLLR